MYLIQYELSRKTLSLYGIVYSVETASNVVSALVKRLLITKGPGLKYVFLLSELFRLKTRSGSQLSMLESNAASSLAF